MRKSTILLMIAGIVFGIIVIVWQFIPLLFTPQLQVTWTPEANKYRDDWMTRFFLATGVPPDVVDRVVAQAVANAEEVANHTDYIVNLIDLRVGMALTFWSESQNGSTQFPRRYSWNADLRERSLANLTAWERLREVEQSVAEGQGVTVIGGMIQVDWDLESVNYYYNPGDPQFGVPERPNYMAKVLHSKAGDDTEFRNMFANATTKAEEIANQTDKIVNLPDLKEAMATILYEYNKYPTLDEARAAIPVLEQDP